MSENRSLILQQQAADAEQLKLFGESEVERNGVEELESRGEYTGERLFRFRPEVYQAIVGGRANGLSIGQICRAFRVSPNTVYAVMEREGETIERQKEGISRTLRHFVRASAERMLEEVQTMDIDKLGIPMGIAVDKIQLLDGQPTQRVETVKQPGIEEFNKLLQSLPRTIDVAGRETTGLGEGDAMQIAAAPGVTADVTSLVSSSPKPKQECGDVVCDDNSAGKSPEQTGGEGVPISRGGGQKPNRFNDAENFDEGPSEAGDSEEREPRIKTHGNNNPGSY